MSPPLLLALLAYPVAFVQVFPYHNASSYIKHAQFFFMHFSLCHLLDNIMLCHLLDMLCTCWCECEVDMAMTLMMSAYVFRFQQLRQA